MTDQELLEIFERAFRGRVNGFRVKCECGITYWDAYNSGYDLEEGEPEELADLEAKGEAKPLNYAVGMVEFEGRHYVDGCTCWHDRAIKIARWILAHDSEIAEFLRRRKKALELEAQIAPVVE